MFKKIMCVAAVCGSAFIGSSAFAQNANAIDDSYGGFSVTWSSVGGTTVRYKPFIVNGELVICGGFSSHGGARQTRASRAMLKESSAKLNGHTVMRDMSFFSAVNSRYNDVGLVGQPATCRSTGDPASPEMLSTFEFDNGDGRVRVRR